MIIKARLSVPGGIGLVLLACSAQGQEGATQPTASDHDSAGRASVLAEIVVTAERREARLQDTPIAVSAFDADTIAALGTENSRSLMGLVPNLYMGRVSTAPSTQTYGMRGLAQTDTIADPTVAVYVDDVYLARSIGAMADLPDVERIEVLRGPQGTLYGRNATGGAIKFVSADPSNEFRFETMLGAGNLGQREARALISGPIVNESIYGSIAAVHRRRDGYTYNVTADEHQNALDFTSVRGKLIFTPSEQLRVRLTGDFFADDSDTTVYTAVNPPAGEVFDPYVTYENDGYRGGGPIVRLRQAGLAADLSYELQPNLSFKSITAYRGFQGPYDNEDDGLPAIILATYSDYRQRQLTQEFQLNGEYGALKFTSGLYYFREDYSLYIINMAVLNLGASPSIADANLVTTGYAGYGQLDYEVLDGLTLTAGARYTDETRDYDNTNYQAPDFVPGTVNYVAHAEHGYDAFTPKLGIQYEWSPTFMVYGNYSKGFQAGGFAFRAAAATIAQQPYDPQFVTTWEAGIKSEWFARTLRANLAVFRNDISDMQLTAFKQEFNTSIIQNAGKAVTRGVELELSAVPLEGLVLSANAGYLDSYYTKFDNAFGPGTSGVDKQLQFAPEWVVGGAAIYTVPHDLPGTLQLSVDARYQSKTYLEVANLPGNISPPQTFVNAGINYSTPDSHWNLALTVNNATDRTYAQYAFWVPSINLFARSYNPPRTYLASVRYSF